MHLQGPAGTGKSKVADAVKYLAHQCGYLSLIVKVAPSGIAAVNISGATAHSKFNFNINRKITDVDIESWCKVRLILWVLQNAARNFVDNYRHVVSHNHEFTMLLLENLHNFHMYYEYLQYLRSLEIFSSTLYRNWSM